MPAARHGDRIRSLVIVLGSVLRAGNRITYIGVSAHNQEWNSRISSERRWITKPQAASGRVILCVLIDEYVAKECQAHGLHRLWRDQVNIGNCERIRGNGVGDGKAGNIRSINGKRIEGIGRRCGIPREDLVVVPEVVVESEAPLIVVIRQQLGRLLKG